MTILIKQNTHIPKKQQENLGNYGEIEERRKKREREKNDKDHAII